MNIQPSATIYALMAADLITVVILGASGAALALKGVVEIADTLEKTASYCRRTKKAFNRAFISAKIYSRRKTSRIFNFFWFLFTGHPITGPENDPQPPKPGGGRKVKLGPIATVGYGSATQPIVVRAGSSPCSRSSPAAAPMFCTT